MLLDRYQIMGELGAGITGTVYLARDVSLNRLVAVKRLAPHLASSAEFIERFRGEARVMATIESVHCIRVYAFVEDDGEYDLISEFVDGATLRKVIEVDGRLAAEQALGVVKGALLGLADAHAHGLVHRDIKPENILADREGVSKLADFGLAVSLERAATGAPIEGTAAYISPEQVRGKPIGITSDIYSCGAMLFELLTGRPPFVADDPLAAMRKRLAQRPPSPRQVNRAVPPVVSAVVRRAMSLDPAGRPQTATAFLGELEDAATAAFGSDWERRASISSRVSAAAAAGAAAGILTAGGAGGVAAEAATATVSGATVASAGGAGGLIGLIGGLGVGPLAAIAAIAIALIGLGALLVASHGGLVQAVQAFGQALPGGTLGSGGSPATSPTSTLTPQPTPTVQSPSPAAVASAAAAGPGAGRSGGTGGGIPTGTAGGGPPPAQPYITFTSTRNGGSEIFVMAADGGGQRNIGTAFSNFDLFSSRSAAGQSIVFESTRSADGIPRIYRMGADGSGVTQLSNPGPGEVDAEPRLSRDGSLIVFVRYLNSNGFLHEIWMMNADGSNPHRVIGDGSYSFQDDYPELSAQNNQLIFQSNRDGSTHQIYVANPDGSNVHLLFGTPTGVPDEYPAFSPDGNRVAFSRNGNLATVGSSGGTPTLLSTPGQARTPSWSPDGSRLVVELAITESGLHRQIYTISPDGSSIVRVTNQAKDDEWPSWGGD